MDVKDKENGEVKPTTSDRLHERLQQCGIELAHLKTRLLRTQSLFYFLCEYDPQFELPGGPAGNVRLEHAVRAILDDADRRCDLLVESARKFDFLWREVQKLANEACAICDHIAQLTNDARIEALNSAEPKS